MDFLKEIFGNEALTFEQLGEKLKGTGKDGSDMKLADLSQGEYVGIGKFNAKETTVAALQQQLETANKTIAEFKSMDIDGIKKAANDYKQQAEQAQASATAKEQAAAYRVAAVEAACKLAFTSNSAKQAYISLLTEQALPLENGKLIGLSAFEQQYKENDPGAFKSDSPALQITVPSNPPKPKTRWQDNLARNYNTAKAEQTT